MPKYAAKSVYSGLISQNDARFMDSNTDHHEQYSQMEFDGITIMIGSFVKLKNAEQLNLEGHRSLGIPDFAQVIKIIKTRKGGIIRVLWYYGYNNKIGKLPIDNVANSDFPKFCENDIFWETRADPLTGVIYRENISQVSSMVRVNYKNDPREMANISKTRYCYRFNVKLIDGKTMLYPADLKETRIDDSIYSNKHLKDTFGSSKLPAIKKGAPTPSTSKQVEKAESPIETENSNDSSEEEVIVQKKSPPKKLPDHPALAALPKRRLFKHKDVASDSSFNPDDENGRADKMFGEAARKNIMTLMARKQTTLKGKPSSVKAKASKKGKSVLDNALEVQSEEEETQAFAVSKSATLQAKKDAENMKLVDAIAEAEELFGFPDTQETDSRSNLGGTKKKSAQSNKAASQARNDICSGSDSDSVAELNILSPKKPSTRKSSKLDLSANISDEEQAVTTRRKSQSASEGKGRTPVRSSPRKSSRAARESSSNDERSPSKKLLRSKSAMDAKQPLRMTPKKSQDSLKKSATQQVSSGDSDLEILSPKKPTPSKTMKSNPVRKQIVVAAASSDSDSDEENLAKKRKPNDESDSSDDTVLFKTKGKTTPKATRSSKSNAGPSKSSKTLVVSLSPLRSLPVKKSSDILQSQKEGGDSEGTKIITKLGTPGSKAKLKKSKRFNLSDNDSDEAVKVKPKCLMKPVLKKAATMASLLDTGSSSSSDSDNTFNKFKHKRQKRRTSKAASSTKKDQSEEAEELVGVRKMIEHLQSSKNAAEAHEKSLVTKKRQTRSLLNMLEVNVPADETKERVNSDKDSADELYEETRCTEAKIKVPVSSRDVSFTPIIRPEGEPIGATVTIPIPSPSKSLPLDESQEEEAPKPSSENNSEFVTPLSSPEADRGSKSPDMQVKTDSGSGYGLNKLFSAIGGILTKNFKKDEHRESVPENNPGENNQVENDGAYEADMEEEVTVEQNDSQPKRTTKRTRRTQATNSSGIDDKEDQASPAKPSQEMSTELSGFEFVPLRKTRSTEKKAPKFNADVYIQKFIENNPKMSSRSKTNLVTAASELKRLDTQCVSSLTGGDVLRASDEDEVAQASTSNKIPTEQYKVTEVTNSGARKLSIILKRVEPSDDDKTASEVESELNEPITLKKNVPSILRPKSGATEKQAKSAEEPARGPSTPTTTPKKPRKEKIVVLDHGAISINGRKTTLSLASPKLRRSKVLVASPAKDGSLRMKIRSPEKPTLKIDQQLMKTPEKKPGGSPQKSRKIQSPTKMKSPMEVEETMPVEQGTPKKGGGSPSILDARTKKSLPAKKDTPIKGKGSPPKTAKQKTPQGGKSHPSKLLDEDRESTSEELETPKKLAAKDEKSSSDDKLVSPLKKRGRLPKSAKKMTPRKAKSRPSKLADEDEESMSDKLGTPKKGRGRPPKVAVKKNIPLKNEDHPSKISDVDEESSSDEEDTPPKKRGRPPKSAKKMTPQKPKSCLSNLAVEDEESTSDVFEESSTEEELDTPPKKRGRPPKAAEQMTPKTQRGRPPNKKTPNKTTPTNRRWSLQAITPIRSPASRRVSMIPRIEAVREETPSKRRRLLSEGVQTPEVTKTRGRPRNAQTPLRYQDESDDEDLFKNATPKRGRGRPAFKTSIVTPRVGRGRPRMNPGTPSKSSVSTPGRTPKRGKKLAVEDSDIGEQKMPGREEQMANIQDFIESRLEDKSGGCMYISGLPGTGKTASVNQVLRNFLKLRDDNECDFKLIQVSGMELTQPQQVFCRMAEILLESKMTPAIAQASLTKFFLNKDKKRTSTILVIDELDMLCTKKQDVVYHLFDWPTKASARLIVLTIANTMDLPERLLQGKVTSRMGLTRLTFRPYTHEQLEKIVHVKLGEAGEFDRDARQLVARKVASLSGDARRALEICKRALELMTEDNGKCVQMAHVMKALKEMLESPIVEAIKNLGPLEKLFLDCMSSEIQRTGVEETTLGEVVKVMKATRIYQDVADFTSSKVSEICARLASCRLVLAEQDRAGIKQRISLNVNSDDLHYALKTAGQI